MAYLHYFPTSLYNQNDDIIQQSHSLVKHSFKVKSTRRSRINIRIINSTKKVKLHPKPITDVYRTPSKVTTIPLLESTTWSISLILQNSPAQANMTLPTFFFMMLAEHQGLSQVWHALVNIRASRAITDKSLTNEAKFEDQSKNSSCIMGSDSSVTWRQTGILAKYLIKDFSQRLVRYL